MLIRLLKDVSTSYSDWTRTELNFWKSDQEASAAELFLHGFTSVRAELAVLHVLHRPQKSSTALAGCLRRPWAQPLACVSFLKAEGAEYIQNVRRQNLSMWTLLNLLNISASELLWCVTQKANQKKFWWQLAKGGPVNVMCGHRSCQSVLLQLWPLQPVPKGM